MPNVINATSTGNGGLITQGDDSGILNIQTNETTAITVDASQRVAFVAGTAALPAITTDGDTNTGIFFPAADTIAFSEGGTEAMRIDSSGNLQFNSGYGSVATAYGCRAWVNFNGGLGNTAGTINGSGNVSSITVHGTGDYTVNFTNAMPNVNYATFGGCREDNAGIGNTSNRVVNPRRDTTSITTTTCRIGVTDFGYVAQNVQLVFFSVFR